MPGGRIPKVTRNDPGDMPDKGLVGRGQHHIAQPGPKPTMSRDTDQPFKAGAKFEPVPFDQVAGGPGNAHAGHGGHGKGTGAVSLADKAAARGHNDASSMFAAQKGHSPKRSAGKKTGTDEKTARDLSTAGS
jgi:hypothetical protein